MQLTRTFDNYKPIHVYPSISYSTLINNQIRNEEQSDLAYPLSIFRVRIQIKLN